MVTAPGSRTRAPWHSSSNSAAPNKADKSDVENLHYPKADSMSSLKLLCTGVLALVVLALVPHAALAQSGIAGVVKDTSGAVLPGVTVEAASPALIEKVRTAVTGGDG